MCCTGELSMLHTVPGQVTPTPLPLPCSHDLSTGSCTIHSAFLDPFCSHIYANITEGHRGAAPTRRYKQNKQTMAFYIHCKTHTVPPNRHICAHTSQPPFQSRFTYPGQAAAAARGVGAEGSNPRCRSHWQGSLS